MTDIISLLIADDHALVRQGIRAFLEVQEDLTVLGEADGGEEAVRMAAELAPDVVLMDLVMPGIGGVEATRQVKQVSPHTQIIVLTSYHEDEYIFPALRAGALSYVLKDINPDELADTVRKAARGESVLHPRVAARVVQELRGARKDAPNLFTDLSDRELEVLRLIADGRSNAEIANRLVISEKTVKGHVSKYSGEAAYAGSDAGSGFGVAAGVDDEAGAVTFSTIVAGLPTPSGIFTRKRTAIGELPSKRVRR